MENRVSFYKYSNQRPTPNAASSHPKPPSSFPPDAIWALPLGLFAAGIPAGHKAVYELVKSVHTLQGCLTNGPSTRHSRGVAGSGEKYTSSRTLDSTSALSLLNVYLETPSRRRRWQTLWGT